MELMFAGVPRSPHWEKTAQVHLKKQPLCLGCGNGPRTDLEVKCGVGILRKNVVLNVHHKFPFHYVVSIGRPDLELDERNLYTLCVEHEQEHHLLIGHLGCFESYNPWLEHHLALFRGLLASQIKATAEYKRAVLNRPKPLHEMDDGDKRILRKQLDFLYPTLQPCQSETTSPE